MQSTKKAQVHTTRSEEVMIALEKEGGCDIA
jgi:hypothetical protein